MTAADKKTIKFQMMMSPAEAEALDDWGFSNRIKSRAEAIRQLVKMGMLYGSASDALSTASELLKALLRGEQPPLELLEEHLSAQEKHLNELKKDLELTKHANAFDTASRLHKKVPQLPFEELEAIAKSVIDEALEAKRKARKSKSRKPDSKT